MAQHLRLRSADAKDAATIAKIHVTARESAMPWLPKLHTLAEVEAYFKDQVLPNDTVILAEREAPIGFAAFGQGWLNHLYIAPGHWRSGAGSALVAEAKRGRSQLELWAFQGNHAARAFYRAHGFREVELTDGAGSEERMPDVRLLWTR